uniref:Uncharacterized protein n=1 Tax=Picea glauca TaxID=3330 RepID=A0A117NH63_PICGL|nr:hypothetical protein ABT39_MTgene4877 [Picea glauca]
MAAGELTWCTHFTWCPSWVSPWRVPYWAGSLLGGLGGLGGFLTWCPYLAGCKL